MRMCKISENCLIFVLIFTLCYPLILVASSETGMIESTLLNDAKNQINTIKTEHIFSVSLKILLVQGNRNPAIVEVKIDNTGSDIMYVRNCIDVLVMNAGTNSEIWYEYGLPHDTAFVELHSGESVVLSVLASGKLLEEIMHGKSVLIPLHCLKTVDGMQKEVCYDMVFVLPDGQLSVDGEVVGLSGQTP